VAEVHLMHPNIMFSWSIWLSGGALLGTAAVCTWAVSVRLHHVSIVDSLWPLMFLMAAGAYLMGGRYGAGTVSGRAVLTLALVAIWALRLSVYITWRNWGQGEDRRYQAIRDRNQPGFAFKSVYLVFGLQAVLAWVISLPLLGAMTSASRFGPLDAAGAALWLVGLVFEAGGDWQLARFKSDPANRGRVMDRGLWRYTRHPNYFGDFCIWWGFFLLASSAGAWWSLPGPLLMSLLLMRVSGVTLLEKDIAERRPPYVEYIRRTNAFFPWSPRP